MAPSVGTALMAAWWLHGFWCGSSLVAERQEWTTGTFFLGLPSYAVAGAAAAAGFAWEPPVSYGGFWKNLFFHVACVVALFALGNLDFAFALVSFSPLVFGCCLWSTSYWFFGTRALLGSTVDTCSMGGFGRISSFSTLR